MSGSADLIQAVYVNYALVATAAALREHVVARRGLEARRVVMVSPRASTVVNGQTDAVLVGGDAGLLNLLERQF